MHQGVFGTVQKLFGLTFHERKDLPVYHPEVKACEVKDADESLVGILYMDFHHVRARGRLDDIIQ
ncbi:MAG: hypothetical protein IPN46_14045 [Saprospiraceae bacterium]|nr:hypothetical protein [Saprospiraceae bacterium]